MKVRGRGPAQTWLNRGRGGRVKYSFCLRDPVQRVVSGLRHHCTKNHADISQVLTIFKRGKPYVGLYRGRPNGYVLDNFSTRLL